MSPRRRPLSVYGRMSTWRDDTVPWMCVRVRCEESGRVNAYLSDGTHLAVYGDSDAAARFVRAGQDWVDGLRCLSDEHPAFGRAADRATGALPPEPEAAEDGDGDAAHARDLFAELAPGVEPPPDPEELMRQIRGLLSG